MGKKDYSFEKVSESHRQAVIDIFNYFVRQSHAAYLEKAVDYLFFDQFLKMCRGYPGLVIKNGDQQVVGFGFMRPHHFADSFQRAAEVTYFILPENTRQGLGTAMLDLFVREARKRGIDSLLANISSRNQESIRFHLKNSFQECGRFLRVGRKFGEDFDVVWMQKHLG
jgi:phosphinothricin acetyltransferase